MLRTERQSARMSKIKNGGLDQHSAGPFEQQQFGTAGTEGVKREDKSNYNKVDYSRQPWALIRGWTWGHVPHFLKWRGRPVFCPSTFMG